ncbi:MAG: hypothetical protein ABIR60_08570 [Allosphingosinicella sp.]
MKPAEMFYTEARRRMMTVLDKIGAFELDHRRAAPAAWFDRLRAVLDQVEAARAYEAERDAEKAVSLTIFQAAIEDMIAKAERDITTEIANLVAVMVMGPPPPEGPVAGRGFSTRPRGSA